MKTRLILCAALLAAGAARADTKVEDAWVRGTVPQQHATGMFGRITSSEGGTLVSASSPLAATVEIHEMAMHGDMMHMSPLKGGLKLPAGQAVELKPGGMHVMLMGLKKPLSAGDEVPLSLVVEHAGGKRETVQVKVPVRPLGK